MFASATGLRRILARAGLAVLLAALSLPAPARTAKGRIATVSTPVATLRGVRVQLDWPADAASGTLQLWAGDVDAPDLGYRYRDLHWRCPLLRDGHGGLRCDGVLRAGRGAPMRLALDLGAAVTHARLQRGDARIEVLRTAATPDSTRIDLAQVPVQWAQALLDQAWKDGRLKAGTVSGRLDVTAQAGAPLRVQGRLALADAGLETPDARIAAEGVAGGFDIDYRKTPALGELRLDGGFRGGQFLAGNTYVALPDTPVQLELHGRQAAGQGWVLPMFRWRDGEALVAEGSAAFGADASLRELDVRARSADLAPLRPRYLSGWMGLFGLGETELAGGMTLHARLRDGVLQSIDANLHQVDLGDPAERFVFGGLDGGLRYARDGRVDSSLRWRGGKLYGLEFGPGEVPLDSIDGVLHFRQPVTVPAMGGALVFEDVTLRPPQDGNGMDLRFALDVRDVDFGQISKAVGLPAFEGRLSGRIPSAHYYGERLEFDGGLAMRLFDGDVRFSSLALERPFGTAPSLSADIDFSGLDLLQLTSVLDAGSVTGRVDGWFHALRLVDWTPVAFDASLRTRQVPGVRQRISQRAVQNISSVGDASFVTSLQGQLIGLFDDFGYSRIGISCRLANEVCEMGGLHSAGDSFTIVEGAGIPRLTVVGFNRRVDWPTLVERLAAIGKGDVKPVVD